jgi:hypothetical protein
MIEDLAEKVADVVVRERVVDMLALTRAGDESRTGELLEPLRHRRQRRLGLGRELGDTVTLRLKDLHQTQPRWIAQRGEQLDGPLQDGFVDQDVLVRRVISTGEWVVGHANNPSV